MRKILDSVYAKPLTIYLVIALLSISTFTGPAEAMFLPVAPPGNNAGILPDVSARAADLIKIRTALESKVVGQRLMDYGLSPEEAMTRVSRAFRRPGPPACDTH